MRKALTLFAATIIVFPACSELRDTGASKAVPETRKYTLISNQREVVLAGVPCSIGTHLLRVGVASARILAMHVNTNGEVDEIGSFFVRTHLTSAELPEHNEQHHYGLDVFPDDIPNSVTLEVKELREPTYHSKPLLTKKILIGKNGYFVSPISAHGDILSPAQVIMSIVYNSEMPLTDKDKEELVLPLEQEALAFCKTKKCEMVFFVFATEKPKN